MGWPWKGTSTPRCGGMEVVLLLLLLLRTIPVLLVQAQAGGGRIVLSEFMIDPQSAASKLDGTYIELYNAGDASVDLLNQQLLVNNFYATFVTSVIVQPKTFAVIANSAINASNGGLPYVSYVLDSPFTWQVSGGRLLYGTGTFTGIGWTFGIDWGGSTGRTLPWTPGASLSYNVQKDPNFTNTTDYSNWCVSVTRFGSGNDKGTPGSPNVCVLPPTRPPTRRPTKSPNTKSPTKIPSKSPTKSPSKSPTKSPTRIPTKAPIVILPPQRTLTKAPTKAPTAKRLGPIRHFIRRIFG
jgi:Lamin Tail Domain